MEIFYDALFLRQFKKLPQEIRVLAARKETFFKKNPRDPHLKLHKLSGPLQDFCAFSVDFRYRIICEFETETRVLFYQIGTHDIYD